MTVISSFCASCGWPMQGARCDACGATAGTAPLEDTGRRLDARMTLPTKGLDKAIEAWQAADYVRALSHCLGALGVASRAVHLADGPGWILTEGNAALFIATNTALADVAMYAPLVVVPHTQRVPVLRLALELSAENSASARLCLRNDLLLLRASGRHASLSPPVLTALLRKMLDDAPLYLELFVHAFDARPALAPELMATVGWEAIGEPKVIPHLAFAANERSGAGSQGTAAAASRTADSRPVDSGAPTAHSPAVFSSPAKSESRGDSIPPILAPAFLGAVAAPASPPRDPMKQTLVSASQSQPQNDRTPPPGTAKKRPTLHELELDMPTREAGAGPDAAAVDALCEVLQTARALAAGLNDRPVTVLLVVRATIYRAIHEFGDTAPDAVAQLFAASADATREIHLSHEEGKRRPTLPAAIPTAEAALAAMDRIVALRARVGREKPVVVEPITAATVAKEHLARYLGEIERAPNEAPLRHFLALGALSELLVRTKLPARTQQRVRDIVHYAQRSGPTAASVDLMMTALTRITGP